MDTYRNLLHEFNSPETVDRYILAIPNVLRIIERKGNGKNEEKYKTVRWKYRNVSLMRNCTYTYHERGIVVVVVL